MKVSQCILSTNAGFRLACRSPLCSANAVFTFIVNIEQCYRNGSSQSGLAPGLN